MNTDVLSKIQTLFSQGHEEFSDSEAREVSDILDAILPSIGLDYGITVNRKADSSENWLIIV
jgi:hypothetical protein